MRIELPQRTDLLLRIQPTLDGEPIPLDGSTFDFAVATITGRQILIKRCEVSDDRVLIGISNEESDISPGVYRIELLQTDVEGARIQAGKGLLVITPSIFGRDDEDGVSDHGG